MDEPITQTPDRPGQFSILSILLGVAAIAAALKLSLVFQSPAWFSAALIAWMAWLAIRVGRLGKLATILAAIGTQCLVVASFMVSDAPTRLFGDYPADLLTGIGTLLLLVAAFTFFFQHAWWSSDTMPGRTTAAAVACLVVVMANFVVARPFAEDVAYAVRSSRRTRNSAIAAETVATVDAIFRKLGRTPGEAELLRLLGKRLPTLDCGCGDTQALEYTKTGPKSYRLTYVDCGFWADTVTYDSSLTPPQWVRVPF